MRSRPTRPRTGWPNGPATSCAPPTCCASCRDRRTSGWTWTSSCPPSGLAGHIAVGKLWEYYCQYVYLPRLAERSVLDRGILAVFDQMIWDHDGFAVAVWLRRSHRAGTLGLAIPQENVPPQITDSTLLVRPDRAIAQREQERAEQEAAARRRCRSGRVPQAPEPSAAQARTAVRPHPVRATQPQAGSSPDRISARRVGSRRRVRAGPAAPTPPAPKNTRFYGTVRLDPERFGRDLNRLYQEVIQHLAAPEGVDLEITVEISASKKDGYPDDKARIVTENARTLKFDQYGFEDR